LCRAARLRLVAGDKKEANFRLHRLTGGLFSGPFSMKPMESLEITAYLKPTCGWSNGVRAILRKYELPHVERDIIAEPAHRRVMEERSGQRLSPCVEVNGVMLADISGEELEHYLVENGLVQRSDREPEVPTDRCCSHHKPRESAEPTACTL
jgi:monothiol glutaredoxin